MLKTNLNTDQNELIQYLNVKPEDINQKEVAKLLTPSLSLASAGTEISLQVKKEGEFYIIDSIAHGIEKATTAHAEGRDFLETLSALVPQAVLSASFVDTAKANVVH